jgi:hypothetical protein
VFILFIGECRCTETLPANTGLNTNKCIHHEKYINVVTIWKTQRMTDARTELILILSQVLGGPEFCTQSPHHYVNDFVY